MSNAALGLLVGACFGVWVYTKLMRNTGNNTKSSAIGGAIAGLLLFLVVVTAISFVE